MFFFFCFFFFVFFDVEILGANICSSREGCRSVLFSKTSSVYSNILVNFSMRRTIEEKRKMRNGSKKRKQHQKSQLKRGALIELRIIRVHFVMSKQS